MDNFYVTLISNNSSSITNQPASFRTYLPYSIHLDGQWECSLAELSFMKSWNNIEDLPDERDQSIKQTTFRFILDMDGEDSILGNSYQVMDISTGHYTTIEDLTNNFNGNFTSWTKYFDNELKKQIQTNEETLKKFKTFKLSNKEERIASIVKKNALLSQYREKPLQSAVKMGFDNIKKRITLEINKDIVPAFGFSSHLNYMLGFKDYKDQSSIKITPNVGKVIAEYPVNFNAGANSLYVYSDVIQPNIVSNKMARLLRIVNGSGEYGVYVSKSYTKPYYIPVSSNTINSIEIEIKDEMDRHIKFSFGITIALLHFQKRRPIFPLSSSF